MGLSPLHRLAEIIRRGDYIEDKEVLDILGEEGTVVVSVRGGERHLPSGEILAVLADSAGLSVDEVLARNFRMSAQEISDARSFYDLVQFTGDRSEAGPDGRPEEQPFQPIE